MRIIYPCGCIAGIWHVPLLEFKEKQTDVQMILCDMHYDKVKEISKKFEIDIGVEVWIDKSKPMLELETTNTSKPSALTPEYQLAKAKEQGYDLAKCLETVMKGDTLEQCKRANGFGLERLYCKQHSVKHKAKERRIY